MLFLANFITIELASALTFGVFLEYPARPGRRPLKAGLVLSLVMCLGVAWFLGQQFFKLIGERRAQEELRQVVVEQLTRLPRTGLISLHMERSKPPRVAIVVRTPQQLPVEAIAEIHRAVQSRVGAVELSVASIAYSYFSAPGRAENIHSAGQAVDPLEDVEAGLRNALAVFPRVDIVDFRRQESPADMLRLFVTVRSPRVLEAEDVRVLQERLGQFLGGRGWKAISLTVRTSVTQDFTAEGAVDRPAGTPVRPEETARLLPLERVRLALEGLLSPRGAEVLDVDVSSRGEEASSVLEVRARVRSRAYMTSGEVRALGKLLSRRVERKVLLRVENVLGQVFVEEAVPGSLRP